MRPKPNVSWAGVCLLLLQGAGATLFAADAPSRQPSAGVPRSVTSGARGGPAFPFRAAYAADTGGSGHQERNLLTLPRQRLVSGDRFSADIRVYDDGGYDYYFNVFWNHSLPLPGELALYDAGKHWLRDLTASMGGPRRTPAPKDWTPIQAPGYAGTVIDCGALSVPAGTYYVQAIFFGSLIHPTPDRNADGWPAIDDQSELMRSEAIPITVVAPEAVRSVPRKNASRLRPTSKTPAMKPTALGVSPLVPQGMLGGVTALPDQDYPFRDGYPIPKLGSWGHSGHSVLSLPSRLLRQGQRFNVDIRLYNDGGVGDFFNVYWNGLLPLPGGLALYDGRKRFVCDLLTNSGGSRVTTDRGAWTGIPTSCFAGMVFSASLPSLSGLGAPFHPLPAGTYYVQVIYAPLAVAPPDVNMFFSKFIRGDAPSGGQADASPSREEFRSNAVKVTVVD